MIVDKHEIYQISKMELEDIEVMCIGLEYVKDDMDFTEEIRSKANEIFAALDNIIQMGQ